MRNLHTVKIVSPIFCFLMPLVASAQGLLGERYVNVQASFVRPGNDIVRAIDDSVLDISANLNIPASENVDVTASLVL